MSFSEDPKPVSHQVKETKVIYILDLLFLNTSYDVSDYVKRERERGEILAIGKFVLQNFLPSSTHTTVQAYLCTYFFPLHLFFPCSVFERITKPAKDENEQYGLFIEFWNIYKG